MSNGCNYTNVLLIFLCQSVTMSVIAIFLYLLTACWMLPMYVGAYIVGVTKMSISFQIVDLTLNDWMPQLQQAAKQNISQKSNYLLKWWEKLKVGRSANPGKRFHLYLLQTIKLDRFVWLMFDCTIYLLPLLT